MIGLNKAVVAARFLRSSLAEAQCVPKRDWERINSSHNKAKQRAHRLSSSTYHFLVATARNMRFEAASTSDTGAESVSCAWWSTVAGSQLNSNSIERDEIGKKDRKIKLGSVVSMYIDMYSHE